MSKINTPVVAVSDLNIFDKVQVQLGNLGDTYGYHASKELEVIRIEKTQSGWNFLGEWTKDNGDVQLCQCFVNHYGAEATAPYLSLNARTIGAMGGQTREIAIRSLRFSPD